MSCSVRRHAQLRARAVRAFVVLLAASGLLLSCDTEPKLHVRHILEWSGGRVVEGQRPPTHRGIRSMCRCAFRAGAHVREAPPAHAPGVYDGQMRAFTITYPDDRRSGRGHPAALLRAAAASLGTLPAVLHVLVALAFLRAGVADLRTHLAEEFRAFAGAAHGCRGELARLCAVNVKGNAACHLLDVLLLQAGGGAMVARGGAVVASRDARAEGLVRHGLVLPWNGHHCPQN